MTCQVKGTSLPLDEVIDLKVSSHCPSTGMIRKKKKKCSNEFKNNFSVLTRRKGIPQDRYNTFMAHLHRSTFSIFFNLFYSTFNPAMCHAQLESHISAGLLAVASKGQQEDDTSTLQTSSQIPASDPVSIVVRGCLLSRSPVLLLPWQS